MKQRNKYARVGEFVKVVTPKEFVRCGYPLCMKDVMEQQYEEIEKDCRRVFAALENRKLPQESQSVITEVPPPEDFFAVAVSRTPGVENTMSPTVHGMLCAAIAAWRLEEQNFGGNERIIVERDSPFAVGQFALVTGKRFVKTGKRFRSLSYGPDHNGEYDYEPGGLKNESTHCVYLIEQGPMKSKILAEHCERVSNGAEIVSKA